MRVVRNGKDIGRDSEERGERIMEAVRGVGGLRDADVIVLVVQSNWVLPEAQ